MVKFYIVGPEDNGDGVYHLVSETGEHLASHMCSYSGFARHDLESGRPERQKEWKEKFGEYEVLFLNKQNDIDRDELIKRNKKFNEENPESKGSEGKECKVTVTVED